MNLIHYCFFAFFLFGVVNAMPLDLHQTEDESEFIQMVDDTGKLHYVSLREREDGDVPKVSKSDVTFYLYTKNNKNHPHVVKNCDVNQLVSSSHFNKQRTNVFIVHGWNNKHSSEVNTLITGALLAKHDVNVFVVDWSGPALSVYSSAKKAVPQVGVIVGNFINDVITQVKLKPVNFNLIGHSLGAHVVGCAGAQIAKVKGKVNYIIGLDPAGPLFSVENINERLDPSDGDFVQIMHTNGGKLGFKTSIGHVDYYPNGGGSQPGCSADATGTCSHLRSYHFLAESIQSPQFYSVRCDSYKNFENGSCKSNPTSLMGGFAVDKKARGDYYLKTASKKPFALGKM